MSPKVKFKPMPMKIFTQPLPPLSPPPVVIGHEVTIEKTKEHGDRKPVRRWLETGLTTTALGGTQIALEAVEFDDGMCAWCAPGEVLAYGDLYYYRKEYLKKCMDWDPLTDIIFTKLPDIIYGTIDAEPAPKNNDGRDACWQCSQPTRYAGGGAYQVCANKKCNWFEV